LRRCMACYCDVLVLRHPVKGSADEAALAASIPVLNAGDGVYILKSSLYSGFM
jgi:aspartate carbamoyltransferase catalytic subunit